MFSIFLYVIYIAVRKASAFTECGFDIWRMFLLKKKGREYSGDIRDAGLLFIWRAHSEQLQNKSSVKETETYRKQWIHVFVLTTFTKVLANPSLKLATINTEVIKKLSAFVS